MKRIWKILPVLASLALPAHSQDIYNMVLENATRQVNTPTTNYTQTCIAQFKRTALVYLKGKAFETMPEVTTEFLDVQAYYLSEFITLFFQEILQDKKLSDAKRKDKIYLFMEASTANPLFGDKDEETTHAYIKGGNELTPFSLDTDWQKAYFAAKTHL